MDDVLPLEIFGEKAKKIKQDSDLSLLILEQKKTMNIELGKYENFAKRLEIVTATIENIFNILNEKKVLTYDEYREIRYLENIKYKIFAGIKKTKKIKRYKRCKKYLPL